MMTMIPMTSVVNIFTRYWALHTSQSPSLQGRVSELGHGQAEPAVGQQKLVLV